MSRAGQDRPDELMAQHGLRLGSLAYRGSPTQGSVIVYSPVHARWGRVPMPEVTPMSRRETLRHLLSRHPLARWVAAAFLVAVVCLGWGLYGLVRMLA